MAGPKFLVVDDASFIRDLLKKMLRNHFPGSKTSDAASAKKAQSLMRTENFDLILSDWEMPEITGEEFLRWVREHEQYNDIPFIMVSSRGERDYVVQAVKAGVSDYMGKPFTPEDLVQKVTRALKKVGKEDLVKSAYRPESDAGGAFSSAGALGAKTIGSDGEVQQASPPTESQAPSQTDIEAKQETKKKPKAKSKGQAQLQFPGGHSEQCVIREINLQVLQGILKRGDNLPKLFDQVVISIVQNDGESVARLNGYVHSMSAVENRIDCELLKIIIRFVDDDPEKLDHLSRYISSH